MDKNSHDFDVVLLWVDSKDPKWLSDFKKYAPTRNTIASHDCRYRSWDNLEFIFRGVDFFMPWVRKVHFVTHGHTPDWLNCNCKALNIVKHSDIFENKGDLPTFNSNAIEVNFDKISELSEKFIIFNDDTYVLNKLDTERFFINDLPVDFLVQSFKRSGFLYNCIKSKNSFNAVAINNNIDLINRDYSKSTLFGEYFYSSNYKPGSRFNNFISNIIYKNYPWLTLNHVPQPHLKSTITEAWKKYPDSLTNTSSNKFRSTTDTTHYLFRYMNLATGNFFPQEHNDTLSVLINSSSAMKKLLEQLDGIRLLCLTDTEDLLEAEFEQAKELFNIYLRAILPDKSDFEV